MLRIVEEPKLIKSIRAHIVRRKKERKSRKEDKNGTIVISITWDAREEKENYQRQ